MNLSFCRVGVVSILLPFSIFTFGRLCLAGDESITNVNTQTSDYIQALPVKYVMLGAGSFAPAFVDSGKRVLFVWRDVNLKAGQVPNAGEQHRTPVIDVHKTDFTVQEVNPRVRCFVRDEGSLCVGYFDHSSKTFFLWHGLNIRKPDAGVDAFDKCKIASNDVRQQIDIPIPARFWSSLFNLDR
jgi:hypothetical protein